jgi:hypothetical protein
MKISIFALVFLLILCFMLPCLFKKLEGFDIKPSLWNNTSDYSSVDSSGVYTSTRDLSGVDLSGVEGFSTDDMVYSSYDKLIDNDLRNDGHTVSKKLRENPVDKTDELKSKMDTHENIIDFFINLAKKNKEPFNTRVLKDEANKEYELDHKKELYNIDGTLKIGVHDTTDYAAVLEKERKTIEDMKKDYLRLAKNFDDYKYNQKFHGSNNSSNSSSNSSTNSSSNNNSYVYDSSRNLTYDNNIPGWLIDLLKGSDYSSTPSNITGSNSSGSNNTIKCIANFGTNIGDPLCCGQKGDLKNTKFVCPKEKPSCSGYVCGTKFGTCN